MTTDILKPEIKIARLQDKAERIETSFADGNMIWHRWPLHGATGAPIVLLHGGFGSWTHWANAIPLLQEAAPVLAADLPGLGDSDDVSLPHTPEKLAGIITQGLNQILAADAPFHLVGFSFGGMLGSLIAAEAGERCLSFTAVGASGFGDLHYVVEGIQMPSPDMTESEINGIHRRNLHLLMFANPQSSDDLSLHIHRHNVARGRIKSRRLSVSDALLQALPHIKAKIGGIWGELDATGGGIAQIKQRAEIFRQFQADAPFDIIEGAGHWVMQEAPEAFSQALLRQLGFSHTQV